MSLICNSLIGDIKDLENRSHRDWPFEIGYHPLREALSCEDGVDGAHTRFQHSSSCSALAQLNGSLLDGGTLSVHSETVHPDEEESEATHVPGTPLDQSDKPRAGSKHKPVFFKGRTSTVTAGCLVAAEYLAKGYKLSDGILQHAIQLDSEIIVCSVIFVD